MKSFVRCIIIVVLFVLETVSGCGGGGGGSGAGGGGGGFSGSGQSGSVQKGPFYVGSTITIQELDSSLNATGSTFQTQTTDSLGSFTIPSGVSSRYIEIIATGRYFNEVTGQTDTTPLTLRSYSDLSVSSTVNVNVLTSLDHDRILSLVQSGSTYAVAQTQAEHEVLSAFEISSTGIAAFDQMDISGSGESDAVLLAVSSILQNGNSVTQLSSFISSLASDFANDGALSNANTALLATSSQSLDMTNVRALLANFYHAVRASVTVPDFENYIDSQGVGSVNGDLPTVLALSGPALITDGMDANVTVSVTGRRPTTPLTVTVSSSDTARVTVSPASVSVSIATAFLPQTTISGIVGLGDSTITFTASAAGLASATLQIPFKHVPQISAAGAIIPMGWNFLFDSSNNLYSGAGSSSGGYSGILKTSPSGGTSVLFPGQQAYGITIDSADNLYVLTSNAGSGGWPSGGNASNKIQKLTPAGVTSTLCNSSDCQSLAVVEGITAGNGVVDSAGNLYFPVTNWGALSGYPYHYSYSEIARVTPAGVYSIFSGHTVAPGGSKCLDGAAGSATFSGVTKMVIDSSDTIYVFDQGINGNECFSIRQITATGSVSTIHAFTNPWDGGLELDSAGNIYYIDFPNPGITGSEIKKISPAGVESTYCGGTNQYAPSTRSCYVAWLPQLTTIKFNAAGDLYYLLNGPPEPAGYWALYKITP